MHELQVHQLELEMQNDALRQAQDELEESRNRYVDLFESAPVAYAIVAPDGQLTQANQLASQLLGLSPEQLRDYSFDQFIAPCDRERWREQVSKVWTNRLGEPREHELLLQGAEGTQFPAQLQCVALESSHTGPTMRIAFFDITERAEAAAEIHRLAYFDALTGLPNRRLLLDRLAQTLAASERKGLYGAIVFLDLDDFKVLNDTRGHDAGDRLLAEAGRRLRAALREVDTVARMGGDEFVVLLDGLGPTQDSAALLAQSIGEKLRQSIAEPVDLGGFSFHCTTSIGVRLFGPGETEAELLQHADLALYKAKSAGRNRVIFFDPSMQAVLDARGRLEDALGNALRDGQMELHYQPRFNGEGRLVGAESLLRWRHPKHGLMAPRDFLGIAGQTGLILPIGRWVLDIACAQLAAWSQDPVTRNLTLAVNISALEFQQSDFVEHVRRALDSYHTKPEHLTLELTEGATLDCNEETLSRAQELQDLGVRLSVDDFGRGWSSLSRLTRLRLQEIKIDQSLVAKIGQPETDAILVSAIIALAGSLGLTIVAEGVETEAQRRFLASQNCDTFQGFLFGAPLSPADFQRFLRDARPCH
ncbi:putative bifunctional diguanylate cyclase/phosphodiesterase [Thioalkalivibrio sp.]|uniref:putative bifunctional diguanylate cyclase/phosphodiesterase n=1 Tax=Thioalkalivibrio sp. TaxID=2093813 RepID=UPI0039771964